MAFNNPVNELIYHEVSMGQALFWEAEELKADTYAMLEADGCDPVILEGSFEDLRLKALRERIERIKKAIAN